MSTNPFSNAVNVNAAIKIRRGPESDRISNVYDTGELVYSTNSKRVYVGDNIAFGGNIVGNKAWIINDNNYAQLTAIAIGDTVYRTDNTSYYVLTGNAYSLERSYALIMDRVLPKATTSSLGGVIVGNGLNVNNGTVSLPLATTSSLGGIVVGNGLNVNNGTVSLPLATTSSLGGVIVGNGLNVNNGTVSLNLPLATTSSLGGVIVGNGLNVNNGTVSLNLPLATTSSLGGVIVGNGLSVDNTGKLSLSAIPETATTGQILTWNTDKWVAAAPTSGGTSGLIGLSKNILTGNNGTTYTLTNFTDNNADNYMVFVNGVQQVPTNAYSILLNPARIVFTGNVPTGADILVYCTTSNTPVAGPAGPAGPVGPAGPTSKATRSVLGAVIVGNGLNVDNTGLLSISAINPSQINQAGATNGQVLTYSTDSNSWVSTNIYSNRNLIINGDMRIWQRGNSFTDIGARTYTADRWTTSTTTLEMNKNISQHDTLTSGDLPTEAGIRGFARMRYTSGTHPASIALGQGIELEAAGTLSPFSFGKQYTLSFYARSSTAGTAAGGVAFANSMSEASINYNEFFSFVPNLTTSWKRYSYTFTLKVTPHANNTCMRVLVNNGSIGANVDIDITGVQLEKGSIATPFEFRPIGTELALCQRYYQVISNVPGYITSTTHAKFLIPLSNSIRAYPEIGFSSAAGSISNPGGTNGTISGVTAKSYITGSTTVHVEFDTSNTMTGATPGMGCEYQFVGYISAEL